MKAILVDDEALALEMLETKINQLSDIEIIEKFTHFDLKNDIALLHETDIVFLDIEMPQINGLKLAELILQENPDITVVFVTAFNKYAVQAFELNALDYILKPINNDRFKKTLNRIENTVKKEVKATTAILHVQFCNDLSFSNNKEEITHIYWRTTKAKELFAYLLYNHNQSIQKSRLIHLFWSDFDEDRAYSQLYTAIYHIRKSLRKFDNYFSLKSLSGGYILKINNTLIDVIEWENKLQRLPKLKEYNIAVWEETMKLYTGGFLLDSEFHWFETERFRLEQLWVKTAYQMADFYLNINNLEKAESWYLAICALKPEEELAHFRLMEIYDEFGLGLLVNHQYATLFKVAKELETSISPYITKWYRKWQQ